MTKQKKIILISMVAIILLTIALVFGFVILPLWKGGRKLKAPLNIRQNGLEIIWDKVDGALSYVVKFEETEFEVAEAKYNPDIDEAGNYNVNIKAISSDVKNNSDYSIDFKYIVLEFLLTPDKEVLTINNEIVLNKEYDGNIDFKGEILKGVHYFIESELNDLDLLITSKKFDAPDVLSASKLSVSYNIVLSQEQDKYIFGSGIFELNAMIQKRVLQVFANYFSKAFNDPYEPDLTQSVYVAATGEYINFSFTRAEGESIGFYDLTSIIYNNTNYELLLRKTAQKTNLKLQRQM